MGRLRRSRTHGSAKSLIKQKKTKRYGRDLDQIELDLKLSEQIRSIKSNQTQNQTQTQTNDDSIKSNSNQSTSHFPIPYRFGTISHNTFTGEIDEETIGLGEFPCKECARFFINSHSLEHHQKSKIHKRRLKDLANGPYTLEEAMRVAGLGVDNQQRPTPSLPHHPSSDSKIIIDQASS
ncbi:hypothetical protein DFH28DRAFT_985158 [Melampsora americana]|nr:hypothetical protein DFH28DRAFT_985158 [Melampsora americana]